MKKFQSALLVAGLAQESDIRGLSEDAIMGIEADRGLTLPTDYKDFLRECGCAAGLFGTDIDILHPRFLNLNEDFLEAAHEFDISYSPPANAFFFSAYQGGSFHYFLCQGTDTKVYVLNDGDSAPTAIASSFTEFMVDAIASWREMLARTSIS